MLPDSTSPTPYGANPKYVSKMQELIGHSVWVRMLSGGMFEGKLADIDLEACTFTVDKPGQRIYINAMFVEYVKDNGVADSANVEDL